MKRMKWLGVVVALSLVAVACTDSVSESTEDLCESLESLNGTVGQIAGADVSPETTTIDDIEGAVSALKTAVQVVQDDEGDLADSLKADLQNNLDDLETSIEDIPGDSTVAEAGDAVATALNDFRTSWDATLSQLECEPVSS